MFEDGWGFLDGNDVPMAHSNLASYAEVESSAISNLSDLLSESVRRDPDHAAVTDGDQQLSYRELEEVSGRLATRLRAEGVRRQDRVAVSVPRSVDLVVAILAVVRAGAAYVPLDVADTSARTERALARAGVRVTIDPAWLASRKAESTGSIEEADLPGVHPKQAAYVMFTSGSTGRPKGVVTTHEGVANLAGQTLWQGRCGRTLLFSTPAFDASTFEIWAPLRAGGTICVARPGVKGGTELLDEVERLSVDTMWMTAGLLRVMAIDQAERLARIGTLLSGGDVVSPEAVSALSQAGSEADFINGYGPTEATTFTSCHLIEMPRSDDGAIPIGTALDGVQMWPVNDRMDVVEEGEASLYIAGKGLAQGYDHDPSATADRFVANPFGPPGSRLYRTGDIVRVSRDGTYEFVGREDDQVKLRGYRVEPAEISNVAVTHDRVEDCVTVVTGSGTERALASYLILDDRAGEDDDRGRDEWKSVYEDMYGRSEDAAFGENFVGWMSSYTGEGIPRPELQEWRAAAVDNVAAREGERILEIGVGSGMVLAQIAPHVGEYWGTDFSSTAISELQEQVDAQGLGDTVHLMVRAADDSEGIPLDYFDAVVINGVASYFPSESYLEAVLEKSLEHLNDTGRIVLGDSRNYATIEAFAAGVGAARRWIGREPAEQRRAQVLHGVQMEGELLLDPVWIRQWAQKQPGVEGVEVTLKRGAHHNELTRHRYESVVFKGTRTAAPVLPDEYVWGRDVAGLDELEELLVKKGALKVRALNLRLLGELEILRDLDMHHETSDADVLDPEVAWAWAEGRGHFARATWSVSSPYEFELHLRREGPSGPQWIGPGRAHREPSCNTPMSSGRRRESVDEVRRHLEAALPAHMVPAHIMSLDTYPLTPNGKVDRAALPPPTQGTRPDGVPPATTAERELCELLGQLLSVDDVGATDDFTSLGGHSLLATRFVLRARRELGLDLTETDVFETGTARELATKPRLEVADDSPRLRRVDDVEVPASPYQESLWLLQEMRPDDHTYNVPLVQRFAGTIDHDAFAQALTDVVRKHESLRTLIQENEGAPWLRVEQEVDVPVLVSSAGAGAVEAFVETPFRLAEDLPVRAAIWTGDGECTVAVVVHHIACDGVSLKILTEDLDAAYQRRIDGEPAAWGTEELGFRSVATWQNESLQWERAGETLEETELRYWESTLRDLAEPFQLAVPGDAVLTTGPQARTVEVKPELHRRLKDRLRESGATTFMACQVAFALALRQHGAGDDVLLGCAHGGRDRDELSETVGYFVNTLPIRHRLGPTMTHAEALEGSRAACLGAFANHHVPFQKVVERVQPPRRPGRNPVYQAMLTVQKFDEPHLVLGSAERLETVQPAPLARTDFGCSLYERETADGEAMGLEGTLEYDSDTYPRSFVDQLVTAFERALETLVSEPDSVLPTAGSTPREDAG